MAVKVVFVFLGEPTTLWQWAGTVGVLRCAEMVGSAMFADLEIAEVVAGGIKKSCLTDR